MELTVERTRFSEISTQGQMAIDGAFFCYTLELPRKDGLPGSCIPAGRYQVTTYPSPHFGRLMPLINNGPGRSEIEIHWGNYPDNTRGCILLGYQSSQDSIGNSRLAFNDFWDRGQGPMERGECYITITEPADQAPGLETDISS